MESGAFPAAVALTSLAAILYFGWRAFYRSNKAHFKSRISRTLGSVRVSNDVSSDLAIEVHLLGQANPSDWIGLSFEANIRRGPQHPPIMLSRKEAADLAELLTDASQPT